MNRPAKDPPLPLARWEASSNGILNNHGGAMNRTIAALLLSVATNPAFAFDDEARLREALIGNTGEGMLLKPDGKVGR